MFAEMKRIHRLEADHKQLQSDYELLKSEHELLMEQINNSCVLIGITTSGKFNVFTFARNNETFKIQTYSTISDNTSDWVKKCGLG